MALSMITYRSAERLGDTFNKVLESSLNIPYDVFILVDDSPGDATRAAVRRFAEEHGKELIVAKSRLYGGAESHTRATARQTSIEIFLENVDKKWLFFLDDDFILSKGWWGEFEMKRRAFEERNVAWGIAWGINWDSTPDRLLWLRALGVDYAQYLIDAFYRRGGTHDTLIPRGVLKEAQDAYGPIPPELHIYEDAWIWWSIRCLGYDPIIIYNSGVHMNPWRFDIKRELERWNFAIVVAHKYGIMEDAYAFSKHPIWRQILGLARPILGIPLALYINIKSYGLSEGLRRAFVRQYLKLVWRAKNLAHSLKYGVPPASPCEGMARARR